MGMYTEISFRANLIKEVPEQVTDVLKIIIYGAEDLPKDGLPDHELFACDRWEALGHHGSYYFPNAGQSELSLPLYHWETPVAALHGNLKNYDQEIEKFFDWIDPYVENSKGTFLGYSLYEEHQYNNTPGPTLYFKK